MAVAFAKNPFEMRTLDVKLKAGYYLLRLKQNESTNYRDAKYSNVKFFGDEGASRLIPRRNGWARELIRESSPGRARVARE